MLKNVALVFGIILIVVGILGFIPGITVDNMLLGLFHVNFLHNIVHLATGAIAVLVGVSSDRASKLFFQIFGVIYALVALLGFYYGNQDILGVLANNYADAWLHVVIAAISLYLGFGCCKHCRT